MIQNDINQIIMIDDDPEETMIVDTYIQMLDLPYQLLAFNSTEIFLKYLEQIKKGEQKAPLRILIDVHMPVMNGFEVLEQIRKDSAFKDLHIILFSNSNDENDMKKALALGANKYHVKPTGKVQYKEFFNRI